jgi:uncharacterized membrane protein
MMWWNGNGAWVWLMVVPMMAMTWALIALVVVPWARHGSERPASPVERLDGRFAAGDIDVEEYRTRRAALQRHS